MCTTDSRKESYMGEGCKLRRILSYVSGIKSIFSQNYLPILHNMKKFKDMKFTEEQIDYV